MSYKNKYSILTCARWENDAIVEWLAYHRSIGFDHVYLYCNDDDPEGLYEACLPFIQFGFVTFVHYPFQGQQHFMYIDGLERFKDETEWIAFIDIDEFLCLRGINDIHQFMKGRDTDILHFNWSFFGPNGFEKRPKGSVLKQYTRKKRGLDTNTKTFVRTAVIDVDRLRPLPEAGIWHFVPLSACEARRTNVIGDDWTHLYDDFFGERVAIVKAASDEMEKVASIYHYALKSTDDFMRRVQRGTGGQFSSQVHWANIYNSGSVEQHIAEMSEQEDFYLRDYWSDLIGRSNSLSVIQGPPPGAYNLAPLGRTTQSSISEWSILPDRTTDARGATEGEPTGKYSFHTDCDLDAWWQITFDKPIRLEQILVFNRMDHANGRFKDFRIVLTLDSEVQFSSYFEDIYVGGVDGKPFVLNLTETCDGVRIVNCGLGYLSLDHIKIFGSEL